MRFTITSPPMNIFFSLFNYQQFLPLEYSESFGANLRFFVNSSGLTIRPPTDTVSRSIGGLEMSSYNEISNLVLLPYNCLLFMLF